MLAGHTIQAPGGGWMGGELTSAKLNGANYFIFGRREGPGCGTVYGLYGLSAWGHKVV